MFYDQMWNISYYSIINSNKWVCHEDEKIAQLLTYIYIFVHENNYWTCTMLFWYIYFIYLFVLFWSIWNTYHFLRSMILTRLANYSHTLWKCKVQHAWIWVFEKSKISFSNTVALQFVFQYHKQKWNCNRFIRTSLSHGVQLCTCLKVYDSCNGMNGKKLWHRSCLSGKKTQITVVKKKCTNSCIHLRRNFKTTDCLKQS